jgi:hypothetical protein
VGEIRAGINHRIAVAKLEKSMGVSLRNKGLGFREYRF